MTAGRDPKRLLTPAQAAAVVGVSVTRLASLADAGGLVAARTRGGHRRYKYADLLGVLPLEPRDLSPAPLPRAVTISSGRFAGVKGHLIALDARSATVRGRIGGRHAVMVVSPSVLRGDPDPSE